MTENLDRMTYSQAMDYACAILPPDTHLHARRQLIRGNTVQLPGGRSIVRLPATGARPMYRVDEGRELCGHCGREWVAVGQRCTSCNSTREV